MLSAKAIFEQIFDDDEAFRLFCSIAASGEAQGGWANGRIAALVPESYQDLAPKIARHGADEDKHGASSLRCRASGACGRYPYPPRRTIRCGWSASVSD